MAQSRPRSSSNHNSSHKYSDQEISEWEEIDDGDDSGTEEEQLDSVKEIENFFRERTLEFKPLKFYGNDVNCLKLYRIVTRMGGFEKVTSSRLWRLVGTYFNPPRTCTSLSHSFKGYYEKALLDYEKHERYRGELSIRIPSETKLMNLETKAMNLEIKAMNVDTTAMTVDNQDGNVTEQNKTSASQERKESPSVDPAIKAARTEP